MAIVQSVGYDLARGGPVTTDRAAGTLGNPVNLGTMMAMSAQQLRDKYLATGIVAEGDLQDYCRMAGDPQSLAVYYATVAVSGRIKSE